MSLRYILAQTSAELGLNIEGTSEKEFLTRLINRSAKELYESRDMVNCEREQIFSLAIDQQVVALPSYVGIVRALRSSFTRRQIGLDDMRPRYKSDGWSEPFLTWRRKGVKPIMRDLANAGPLTLTIPKAELASFTVVVAGPTEMAAHKVEQITFAAGETSKTTANSYTDLTTFANVGALHLYDVTLADVDGNILSVLGNNMPQASYQIIQVLDSFTYAPGQPYLVEVLYKMAFQPMTEDYDEFICPGYDDAIYWQTLGNYKGKDAPDQAALCLQKAALICGQKERDMNQGIDKAVTFERNELYHIFTRHRSTMWPTMSPSTFNEP